MKLRWWHKHKWSPWKQMNDDNGYLFQARKCEDKSCQKVQVEWV